MNQAAITFVKTSRKDPSAHARIFYRQVGALLEGLHVRYLEQHREKFQNFALFLETRKQQSKIVSPSIMSLFRSIMRPITQDGSENFKKRKKKVEKR